MTLGWVLRGAEAKRHGKLHAEDCYRRMRATQFHVLSGSKSIISRILAQGSKSSFQARSQATATRGQVKLARDKQMQATLVIGLPGRCSGT